MNSVKFLTDEIAFYKKRIEQMRTQVGHMQTANQALIRQLASNDQVLAAYLQRRGLQASMSDIKDETPKVKVRSKSKIGANYPALIKKVEQASDEMEVTDLQSIYQYQNEVISKLITKLKAKDENKKTVQNSVKEVRKQVDKVEKLAKEMEKSREKGKKKLLGLIQEEMDLKNKAIFMNVNISQDEFLLNDQSERKEDSVRASKQNEMSENKLIRKSTAKLKPMKPLLE